MAVSVIFPTDIVTEILSRLPVKPLLRFRCVSKPWCSMIDSKEFVKQHLNQSVNTKTNVNLILGRAKFSISFDSIHPSGIISGYTECLAPGKISDLAVLNSCNGLCLVLIKIPEPAQLCIWNPFTRKYRELPATPIEDPVGYDDILNPLIVKDLTVMEWYAFAYVSETDDYKVVRVVEFRVASCWLFSEAKIFSSKSNEWERIEDFPYQLSYIRRVWGAHLNGILHTVVKSDSSALSIMGFDVKIKQHAMVPIPDLVCKDVGMTVDVLGGCLCLIYQHSIVDVWVMKDYGVKDSWFKLLSIDPDKFSFPILIRYPGSIHLQPLAYSKDGEEVLLRNETEKRIYWYDLRTGTMRQITINITYFYTEVCFESLVSLPGFIRVDNVKGKRQGDLKKDNKETSWGNSLKKDFRLVL